MMVHDGVSWLITHYSLCYPGFDIHQAMLMMVYDAYDGFYDG